MIHRLRNCSGNNRGLTWPSHRDFIRVQPAEMSRSARTPYTAGKETAYERRYELLRPSPRPSRGKLLDRRFGFQRSPFQSRLFEFDALESIFPF